MIQVGNSKFSTDTASHAAVWVWSTLRPIPMTDETGGSLFLSTEDVTFVKRR